MAKLDAMHYAKKQELWALIRELGRLYDENDEFLRVYAKEVYEANLEDLDRAVLCFRDLIEGSRWLYLKKKYGT